MKLRKPRPLKIPGKIRPVAYVGKHGVALFFGDEAIWFSDLDRYITWLQKCQKWHKQRKKGKRNGHR